MKQRNIGVIVAIVIGIIVAIAVAHKQATAPAVTESTKTFRDETSGYTVAYPADWTVDTSYAYDLLGPEEPKIPGVKFHIPESYATGTNLSPYDTGVSVETMANMPACTAYPFLIQPVSVKDETINGKKYSVATDDGAGAGNRYEEIVYALAGTDPCIAVRYYIHSTVVENYEPGTVTAFDRAGLIENFDAIRDSLVVEKK